MSCVTTFEAQQLIIIEHTRAFKAGSSVGRATFATADATLKDSLPYIEFHSDVHVSYCVATPIGAQQFKCG